MMGHGMFWDFGYGLRTILILVHLDIYCNTCPTTVVQQGNTLGGFCLQLLYYGTVRPGYWRLGR